ncbi:hypothetical protein OJ996_23295 [Luteolibacter sp. GHJ8]|uniref:Autotransporter-associated beta strand protein n=1 Tax=Luteolibacter rhizosphaerae TaxID=2989719 RepID=A0ABT3GA64_9BACT|nr:hypothetical protein [Luteolibacter rhizosphaerae]MCW1916532.1 hypothetical protein [Luteolibacter rhizosphaerae]
MKSPFLRVLFPLACHLPYSPCSAASASWSATPASGDWHAAANWSPASVPVAVEDTATFSATSQPGVFLNAGASPGAIVFATDAPAHGIAVNPAAAASVTMEIGGSGITNGSSFQQHFLAKADAVNGTFGTIRFANAATAGANVRFTAEGGSAATKSGGLVHFTNTATAGTALLENLAVTVTTAARAGTTRFSNQASAGNATLHNYGGTIGSVPISLSGRTELPDSSTVGNATIVNQGATTAGSVGGLLRLSNNASAGSASITNRGGSVTGGRSYVLAFDSSTLGNATLVNEGGSAGTSGAITQIQNNSSAGASTITNKSGNFSGGGQGQTGFYHTSKAGTAVIHSEGSHLSGAGASLLFTNSASAEDATITNSGATSATGGQGFTNFYLNSHAGTAAITNHSGTVNGASGGTTEFRDSSSAGDAAIINKGATVSGARTGWTKFHDNSTAGNATFTNEGVVGSAFYGGATAFYDNSSAGTATLNCIGKGEIIFEGNSSAGTARVNMSHASCALRIDAHNAPGVSIATLEGGGQIYIGANTLVVGASNLATTFSGTIHGAGNLTKVGTGEFLFSGVGNHTDPTRVEGGTLTLRSRGFSRIFKVAAGAFLKFEGKPLGNLDYHIDELHLAGVQQAAGVWGSLTSSAPNKSAFLFGNGTFVVAKNPEPYVAWAQQKGVTDANDVRTADPDKDGMPNIMEYAFDGNPFSPEPQAKIAGKLAAIENQGTPVQVMTLTIPVLGTAETTAFTGTGALSATASGVSYRIQAGGNLSSWSTQVSEIPAAQATALRDSLNLPALSPGWSYRSFSVPVSGPAAFLRAVVE